MRQAIAAGVARDSAQRPVLLTVGMVGALFIGGISSLFLVLAPFDIGTYTFDGEPISGPEFLRRLGLLWTAHCALLLGIGYALLSGKSWSRTFMMLHWLLMIAGMVALAWREPAGTLACSVVTLLFPVSIAAWYLYAKENVVRYYDSLRRIEEQTAARAA
jgi:hypothetical protein